MAFEIPIAPGEPSQSFTVTLDGRRFIFVLDWNDRLQRWFFDMSTESGEKIISGKHLAESGDLLRQIRSYDFAPKGLLTILDTTGSKQDPLISTLGKEHRLYYVPAVS